MNKRFFIAFLVVGIFISLIGLKLSFDLLSIIESTVTSYVSTEGEINFTVETSTAVCGDSLCNGAETCSTCSVDCGACPATGTSSAAGGGGGGGVTITGIPNFRVEPENINVQTVSGEVDYKEVKIENTGTRTIEINVFVTGIKEYVGLESNKIILRPGEKKTLILTLTAKEPGVYAGKVLFAHQGIKREILVLFNVVSDGVLFDVSITIPENYKKIKEGQKLPTLIELTKIGSEEGLDVTLNYLIKDFDGNVLSSETETLFVQGTKSFNKEFDTSGLKEGDYVAGLELVYPGGFGSASAHFEIIKVKINYLLFAALAVLILAIAIVIYAWRYYRKKGRSVKKK